MNEVQALSGEVVWHSCVFLPYENIRHVMELWAKDCSAFAVAQHPAEGRTKRIHCHIMLVSPRKKKNSFQRQLQRGVDLPSNSHWFAEKVMQGEFKGQPYSRQELLKYLLKGSETRLKFKENISPAEVEAAVSEWVEPVLGNDTQSKTSKKDVETHYKMLTEIYKDALSKHPDWFNTNYRATVSFFDRELDLERVEILDHHRYFIFMCNTLHKKHIRTSEHELERMYVTLMRMTEGGVEHLFFRISKKLNLQ